MKALTISTYGKQDVLEICERPLPEFNKNQVLVKVRAASINPRDWLLMRGLYPFKKLAEPFPITLGSDLSGTVIATGNNVRSLKVGDDIFGMQPLSGKFGAFAEYCSIAESAVALKPDTISHAEAAAMPCAGMTSFQAIRDLAKLQEGETILINGASGGVGSYAVQIAKNTRAHVVAVCGPTNKELCLELGADDVIDYKEENFEDHIDKYDVIYDVIGRSSYKKSRQALKNGGRYISTIPSFSMVLSANFSKLSRLLPFGKKTTAHLILVKPNGSDLAEMAQHMEEHKLRSLIDTEYPFEKAVDMFEKSQSWRTRGKLVLAIK